MLSTGNSERAQASEAIVKAFARHETFHPRYGWLKKGFDAAARDPECFTRPEAAVDLGVGKNMVRAIRYWCRAFKLTDEVPRPGQSRMLDAVPTEFGRRLLADDGWDPYLESPASLWLLHWKLLQPPCLAPTWYAVFNGTYVGGVSDETLLREVEMMCESRPLWGEVVQSSLKKDIDCLLRMYAPRRSRGALLEDSIDSPLGTLGLIRPVESDRHLYTFTQGSKEGLSDEVLVYSMLDFLASRGGGGGKTVLFSRLAYDENSPGRVFRVGESDLIRAVLKCSSNLDGLEVVEVAGRTQLALRDTAASLSQTALRHLYEEVEVVVA